MSGVGRTWRVVGVLLLVITWWVASSGELLVMAIWGFLGLVAFVVTWFFAAWFDVQAEMREDVR